MRYDKDYPLNLEFIRYDFRINLCLINHEEVGI